MTTSAPRRQPGTGRRRTARPSRVRPADDPDRRAQGARARCACSQRLGSAPLRRVAVARAAQPARGRGARQGARGRDRPAHRRSERDAARRRDQRRRARLRPDRAVPRRPDGHRGDGQRRQLDLRRACRQALPDRRAVRLGRAAAPGDRQDRLRGRPAHRRVVADGRRPSRRRLPGQRGHPAARDRRSGAHDPEVRQAPAHRSTTSSRSAR